MTVETTNARAQYSTNGTTGPFTVPFYFLDDADLQVIYTDENGAEYVLVLNAEYTVTGAGVETGGSVTTVTAYALGGTLTILRSVEPLQQTDFVDGDSLPAESLEVALDRLTMIVQQALEVTDRALVFSPSDATGSTLPAASARASKLLAFDSLGAVSLAVPADGTAASLALSLASSANASDGAGMIGYTGGLSYAANTVGDKLNQIIDVADYGATGNGVTDDTIAINAALTDAIAGQTVYINKPGVYMVSASVLDAAIVVPEGVNLVMAPGAWLTKSDAGGSVVAPLGRNTLTVNIDGDGFPLSGGITGTWGVENVGIRAYADASIGLAATDVVVCNSEIKNCSYGLYAHGAKRWRVYGNRFHRIKLTAVLMGFYASNDSEHNVISGNVFDTLGDYAVAFYPVGGEANGYAVHNTIAFNTATDCNQRTSGYAFGVEQGTLGYQSNFLFLGNHYRDTVAAGAVGHGGIVMATCTNSAAVGNVLYGSLGSSADIGVQAYLSQGCLVASNVIERFRGSAVFSDGSENCAIRGNTIRDCGTTSTSYAAILMALAESTTGTVVEGNDMAWSDGYAYSGAGAVAIGCFVASGKTCSRMRVVGNRIHNAGYTGIQFTGLVASNVAGVTIQDNEMTGDALFGGAGLSLSYCSNLVVRSNIIRDAGAASTITNSSGAVVRNNIGYATEAQSITAAIATGSTVSHGLAGTPTFVSVTPAETGPTDVTVSAVGGTTFTVNFGGGGSKTFYWRAEV